jgi:chemotaxis protein methyltransferase CheR
MAKLLADEGQHERALTLLHTLEQINPLVAHAHYLRALIHQGLAQSQEAKSALRRALYVDPDFALAHYLLGELIYTEGQVPAARRHWQNALAALKKLPPQHNLPFGDGTTVGTLMHVLEKRLGQG